MEGGGQTYVNLETGQGSALVIRHVEWLVVDVDLAGALVELNAEGNMSILLEE
jgi:hypothetical protein